MPKLLENRFTITETIDPANPPSECSGTDLETGNPVLIFIRNVQPSGESVETIHEDSAFQHPNVCKTLCIAVEGSQVFVVTERPPSTLHGLNLKRQRRPWGEEQLVKILVEVVSALKQAQERGLHHGRIRMASIYMDEAKGTVKLAGFTSFLSPPSAKSIEHPGQPNNYLSPELRGNPKNWNPHKFDVFSLGLVLLILTNPKKPINTSSEDAIINLLKELEFSPKFVSVLGRLLEFDVTKRPDAQELAAIIVSEWPEYATQFSIPKYCSQCGGFFPAYSCLCSFPLPLVCERCLECHSEDGSWHAAVSAEMQERVTSSEELCQVRNNYVTLRELDETLTAAVKDIEEYIEECKRRMQLYIESISREFEEQMEELLRVKERARQALCDVDSNFLQKLFDLSENQARIIKTIEKPFFSHAPLGCSNAPPRVEYSEQISALEASSGLSYPRFCGTELQVYNAETAELQSTVDLSEAIDATTSLLFLSCREVFGCGGDSKPTRCFRVQWDKFEWKELSDCICPRSSAGLALLSGYVYVFGGTAEGSEERSAEVHSPFPKVAPTALKSMQYPRSRFNPFVHNELIYLPGKYVESYCPKTDSYTSIVTISWPFDIATAAVFDERLYLFTNTSLGIVNLECQRIMCRSSQNAVKFVSNPSPLLLGNSLYLFNPDAPSVLQLRLGRVITKSEVGKCM